MKGFAVAVMVLAGLGVVSNAHAAEPPKTALLDEETTAYARLKRAEFELLTKFKILDQLADEHTRKSEETPAAEQTRAQWEKDLARDLRDKAATASKQLVSATKEVMDFEQKHAVTPGTEFMLTAPTAGKEPSPAEIAYVSLLNDRLSKVQQELAVALQAGNDLSTELQTNHVPEAMARISFDAQINRRQLWELEREQSDLELRKLEFRARTRTSGQ